MRLTVLGGCGAWPAAGTACSGYLVEHEGYRLLVDPGYATLPKLLEIVPAERIDAVLVSHGHPDHCADLNPLLRARALGERPPAALPVYAPPGALDAVLALDRAGMLAGSFRLGEIADGEVGPFALRTFDLPHFLPNAGLRLSAGGSTLAYTGDTGPSGNLLDLAGAADVYLAEATYPEKVPEEDAAYLSSALQAGAVAAQAGVGRLVLTHLWPGQADEPALAAARAEFSGNVSVARAGLVLDF
ncbi:MBL fold metallo-hydrolase [Nonomuraea sp. NPDC050790]|uniref:MBL fold metallo-hydrolase n=1 Tax=Nonomuraea sp. NPDC050790 TaxID=3364371 RepID=UPI00378B1CFC